MESREHYKVIGENEEKKEMAYKDLQKCLDTASPSLAEDGLEKTPEEIETIDIAQKIVDEIIGKYGGDAKPIPLDHIFVLKDVSKTTKDELEGGVYQPLGLGIGVQREDSQVLFASCVAHELFHAKSFKSVRVDDRGHVHLYRNGLLMIDKKDDTKRPGQEKKYFGDLEEAVVAECTKNFMDKLGEEERFKSELEAINKLKTWSMKSFRAGGAPEDKLLEFENEVKYIPNAEKEIENIVASCSTEKERDAMAAGVIYRLMKKREIESMERYRERSKFYKLMDDIIEKSNGEYKDRPEIFAEFAKADFTGNYTPLARIVERILGKGAFRKMANEYGIDSKTEQEE